MPKDLAELLVSWLLDVAKAVWISCFHLCLRAFANICCTLWNHAMSAAYCRDRVKGSLRCVSSGC